MRKIFLILCLSGLFINAFGQIKIPEGLQAQLIGKQNFYDIRSTVENFYRNETNRLGAGDSVDQKKIMRQRKFWNRWFWYMENRLDQNGNLVDVNAKNLEALEQLQQNNSMSQATSGDWIEMGPSSVGFGYSSQRGIGRVDRLACHPTDPNIIFACTPAGGIWKTTNGGTSWSPISAFLPSLGVSGFVISYANTNVLYALTGDGDGFISGGLVLAMGYHRSSSGVFKSTDGGASWRPTGSFGIAGTWVGYKLIQHPTNANTLFAATSKGIYRTVDGGNTWVRVLNLSFCTDIEFKPNNPDRIYVSGNNNQVYYSTDGGDTWQTPTFDVDKSSGNRTEIAVSPANTSYVYLLMGSGTGFYRFFRSVNSGVDFTLVTDGGDVNILGRAEDGDDLEEQVMYDLTMAVSYNNINRIYTGGINIWKSTDGGSTYTNSSHWINSTPSKFVHADIHHLIINPLDNNLYAATDGGVFRSTDAGVTWTMISTQLRTSQYYHLAGYITNSTVMLAGAQDNGVHRFETSGNVYTEAGGDGFDVEINQLDLNKHYLVINTSVYKTNDNGVTVSDITPATAPDNFFPNLLVGGDFNTLFAGYRDADIKKSTNGGTSWVTASDYSRGNWCMAIGATNSNRIYAAGGDLSGGTGSFRRSDDEGDTWTSVWPTAHISTSGKLTDITVSQNYSGRVWITLAGYNGVKVLYSNDAGASWTNISGTLPDVAVNCVVADAGDNVYIGTDIGVFYRGVSHTDWTPYFTGMPRVPVTELVMGIAEIKAATFGRGIWRSAFYSSCAANLTLNPDMTGRRFYQASTSITTTATLNGGAGTDVYFKAGSYIQLLPGFESLGGSSVTAYLGPCNNGVPPGALSDSKNHAEDFLIKLQSGKSIGGISSVEKKSNNTVSVNIKVLGAGEYFVRIFDVIKNDYIATSKLNCASAGDYIVEATIQTRTRNPIRAELSSGNDLIAVKEYE